MYDDDVTQLVSFSNNSVTFNDVQDGVFNNLYLSFISANRRYKEITIQNNTFFNMNGAVKLFVEISNYSPGIITIQDNIVTN
jgi:hypothetical protein